MLGVKFLVITVICCFILGTNANKRVRRLVYPLNADRGEFPFYVQFRFRKHIICGGVLIGPRHVLTAAHCLTKLFNDSSLIPKHDILAGSNFFDLFNTRLGIKKISKHPDYKRDLGHADIAVIGLTHNIIETPFIKPIALPSANAIYPVGTQLIVSGFGISQIRGPSPSIMRKAYVKIFDLRGCKIDFKWARLSDNLICSRQIRGHGTCKGDSGGPVVDMNKSTVVGIVAGGNPRKCGDGVPDLYTKVSDYLDYIKKAMKET